MVDRSYSRHGFLNFPFLFDIVFLIPARDREIFKKGA